MDIILRWWICNFTFGAAVFFQLLHPEKKAREGRTRAEEGLVVVSELESECALPLSARSRDEMRLQVLAVLLLSLQGDATQTQEGMQ